MHHFAQDLAWLILRIAYAWMFWWPLKLLLSDWEATKELVGVVFPKAPNFFATIMVLVMILGGLMVCLGFYGQVGGALLMLYCLFGVKTHYTLAKGARAFQISNNAAQVDKEHFQHLATLAAMGQLSSGQKNIVLAAVGAFFMLVGTGPLSLHQPSMGILELLAS